MCGFRWYPNSTQRRYDPNAFACLYGHHPFRREEQLVFKVGMPSNHMAMREIPRTPGHLRQAAAIFI
jgi:hypothetical protein